MIVIGNKSYELLKDHRDGWNQEAFRERYSEVLDRYDYIVGDWGYNQLRLKGFYRDNHPKAAKDSTFSSMSDYINEYCNFGCAHFVLQKVKEQKELKERDSKEPAESRESLSKEESKGSKEGTQEAPKPGKERERHEAKEPRRESRESKEPKEKEGKPSKEAQPSSVQSQ